MKVGENIFHGFFGLEQIFCDPRVFNSVDRVGDWEEEWANRVADAFEKLISENSKRHLNEIKKKEVSAIRRWVNKVQILHLTSISQTTDAREEEPEPEQLRTTNPPRHDCAWAIQSFEFMVCRSFWHQRDDFLESSVHGTRPQDADNGKQQPREVILWETVDFAPNWISSKEVHGVAGEGLPALRDGEAVLGGAAAAAHQGGLVENKCNKKQVH